MQVTDPVCGMTIESGEAVAKEAWQGQTYYFCAESCHETFKASPERYANKALETTKGHGSHKCCCG
jgi:Cu+-exporting ATPase